MGYPDNIKAGRMTVVRDAANGGRLELLAADSTILASLALDTPSGAVAGPVLTYAGFPKSTTALVASTVGAPVASARVRSAALADVDIGLTVGLAGSGADVILSSMTWVFGDTITVAAGPTKTHAA